MPNYVTYVSLSMNPESAPVKEILKQLTKNSWTPVWGQYDFAYDGRTPRTRPRRTATGARSTRPRTS